MQAAKRHLTQRIEKLDDKLDQQKALSGQIRDDVLLPYVTPFYSFCILGLFAHGFAFHPILMIPCRFEFSLY